MNDQEIDKLLLLLDSVSRSIPGPYRLPLLQKPEELRGIVRDWLIGQAESFHWIEYQCAIVIPQEWIDKELE